ncbi:MAG TPA: L-threonylcarbamoyladenylate synthase [Ktedonobacteraceae bacterium]
MVKQRVTDVVKIDPAAPEHAVIERAAELLRRGELVVFPTETVYGLGADALQPAALEGIFAAKGRPLSDPLILHIAEYASLEELTSSLPSAAWQLAQVLWPGPLTLILPRGPRVPLIVTAGMETVAVRMPAHPVARALIQALGSPIAAPSANRFMHISPTTAAHALADLNGRVPLILDGGPCDVGVESTILDLSAEVPTVLRPGGVSLEALRTILPETRTLVQPGSQPETQAQKAPGQLTMHYAPSIPLLLYDGTEEAMRVAMLKELGMRQTQGERVGVLVADADEPAFQQSGAQVCSLGDAARPTQLAANLFASLRTLEEAHVQVILCRTFPANELGLAIRDRLGRAAGGKIIRV